jgi:RNA-directed DNA polymerase
MLVQASFDADLDWRWIDWSKCSSRVRSLQRRIVQAVKTGAWRKAKRLYHLLVKSFSARTLAAKKVTSNRGKKTPGVDGEIWDTPQLKSQAVKRLVDVRRYRAKPLRRVYVPKANGKLRPLGIPAMFYRALQAAHLLALSPIAETLADANSYGFRPKRRCADAIDQCFKILRQRNSGCWILEGDIEGFFDHIDFAWIERNIPMDRKVLSKWLRSGYMEDATFKPTTAGVPQGGLISPVIGNLALDGLEALVCDKPRHYRRAHQLNFVRYADDFIVTANNREVLEGLIPRIEAFLRERGGNLSPEKTRITHVSEGFDFLGQTIRKHPRANGKPGKLLITPSAKSLDAIKTKVKDLIKSHKGAKPKTLIDKLNPVLRGWANYHLARRDRQQTRALTPAHTANVLRVQDETCPWCWQVIQHDEEIVPHYRDGDKRNYALANMVYYHSSYDPKTRKEPFGKTWRSRPTYTGVCHA